MNIRNTWFALQTRPRSERKTDFLLRQKGYECFTPTHRQKRRWSDRTAEIEMPLFPTYIFCRLSSSTLGKIVSTPGVTRIVGFGGRPAEVAAEEIMALQSLVRSNCFREPWRYLPDGTLVVVENGPMAGVQGIICRGVDHRRFVISVTLLQRSVAVRLEEMTRISVITAPAASNLEPGAEPDLAIRLLKRK